MKLTLTIFAIAAALTAQAQKTFTVQHDPANGIAPYHVSITYTITTIPGSNLTWLKQNLGADTYAAGVTSQADDIAGWYFQFNRKQAHYGIIESEWQTLIMEDGNWLPENDPCQELGPGWRLPTRTEWVKVDNVNGWARGIDAYRSRLKLHYAGYLYNSSRGTVKWRGSYGGWWSSEQALWERGWAFQINSSAAWMGLQDKSHGYSVRCVK